MLLFYEQQRALLSQTLKSLSSEVSVVLFHCIADLSLKWTLKPCGLVSLMQSFTLLTTHN